MESGWEDPREATGLARLAGTWHRGMGDGSFHFYSRGGEPRQMGDTNPIRSP